MLNTGSFATKLIDFPSIKIVVFGVIFGYSIIASIILNSTFKHHSVIISPSLTYNIDKYNLQFNNNNNNNNNITLINNKNSVSFRNDGKLYKKVKIFCCVIIKSKYFYERAKQIKETWGKKCNQLKFITQKRYEHLETIVLSNITNDYKTNNQDYLWYKTKEAFKYIYKYHIKNTTNDIDWILKIYDDSYVIMENLRNLLARQHSKENSIYFRYKTKSFTKQHYLIGNTAYVLNKNAFIEFVTTALPKCEGFQQRDDIQMMICLGYINATGYGNTQDLYRNKIPLHRNLPKQNVIKMNRDLDYDLKNQPIFL